MRTANSNLSSISNNRNTKLPDNQIPSYPFPFIIICAITIFSNLKPEFIIPGVKDIAFFRQIPNLLTAFLFLLFVLQHPQIPRKPQTRYYFAFIFVMIIGTMTARNFGQAYYVTKPFAFSALFYLSFIGFITEFKQFRKIILLFIQCNILIAILGLVGGGLVRGIPALTDENDFAVLMNILIPIVFFMGISARKYSEKWFYFGLSALFLAGVITSFSRGGFIGLISIGIYCFIKYQKKALALLGSIAVICSVFFFAPDSYFTEIETLKQGTEEHTAATRIHLWGNALKMFIDHPIFGVGPSNSGVWVTTYDKTDQGLRDWGRALHSVYLTLLSENGLVGTFFFLMILLHGQRDKKYVHQSYFSHLQRISKIKNPTPEDMQLHNQLRESYYISLGLTGALIGYLATGAFLSILYYSYYWRIMTYTVVLFSITRRAVELSEKNTDSQPHT